MPFLLFGSVEHHIGELCWRVWTFEHAILNRSQTTWRNTTGARTHTHTAHTLSSATVMYTRTSGVPAQGVRLGCVRAPGRGRNPRIMAPWLSGMLLGVPSAKGPTPVMAMASPVTAISTYPTPAQKCMLNHSIGHHFERCFNLFGRSVRHPVIDGLSQVT